MKAGKSGGVRKSRKSDTKAIDGFILVNKPKGITSFDVIRKLREILNFSKMGHLGTLDPNATGLLPVCTGRATKLSQYLLHSDKRYRAMIRLGQATDTYDADGEFLSRHIEPPELTREQLEEILARFMGTIKQVPPLYSAKKVAGKRLYQYAREGQVVTPEPCEVRIDEITILQQKRDFLELEIASSSGMYVRSLANDIGQVIGCGAFLEDLTRLKVGLLSVDDAHTLEQLESAAEKADFSFIAPADGLLPQFKAVGINQSQIVRIQNGNFIVIINPLLQDGEMVRLMSPSSQMVAVGLVQKPLGSMNIQIVPKVVMS